MAKRAKIILGVNSAYHESSAALIVDGRITAAVEDERFTGCRHGKPLRVDNAHHLPIAAIEYCLNEAGLGWHDLDAIAYSLDPLLRQQHACLGTDGRFDEFGHPVGEAMFQRSLAQLPGLLRTHTRAKLHYVSHHVSHAWYAMGTSSCDQAAILVMDGIGEGASISLGKGDRSQIQVRDKSLFPHSIGLAWEKVARFIGLTEYDACKVMALAGLRPSESAQELADHMKWSENGLFVDQAIFDLEHPDDFTGLEKWFGIRRQECSHNIDIRSMIASALQRITVEILVSISHELHGLTGLDNLVYAGGVALNCRANAELASRGPFSNIHVGPAAHDAGTALGASWHVFTKLTGKPVPVQDTSQVMACGPRPLQDDKELKTAGWKRTGSRPILQAARWLGEGRIVGWLDGCCEFGPRALGHRSLLASAESQQVVDQVNRFKGRNSFEPLALAVPQEYANDMFEIPASGAGLAAWMLMTVKPKPVWQSRLGHILHADGTIRLQVVNRQEQPRFHALLKEAGRLTGLPVLINTSFNPRGKPMPATVSQALPLVEELGLKYVVVDGVCWSSSRKSNDLCDSTATHFRPELAFSG